MVGCSRWARYDLIALDEVGYIPLAEIGAEFLFQVIAERAEKAAVILLLAAIYYSWTARDIVTFLIGLVVAYRLLAIAKAAKRREWDITHQRSLMPRPRVRGLRSRAQRSKERWAI
jgi:hypothetical protein